MYNDKIQKLRRQELRAKSTEVEEILWQKIRNRQLNNLKFLRQYSVGPYILDFFCPEMRLAIELDGEQHKEAIEYDQERESFLKDKDIKTIRFWNNEVINNIENIFEIINKTADNLGGNPSLVVREGEGGEL